ncbi:hypothetical protein HQ563_02055 [bacterium]|nr:hypothetical protein [bacterium]
MMLLAQGQVQFPDYAMLVGYFVLMLAIGAYFYRFMRGMKDYFSGGNNIPWWLSGVSFYMSSFSVAAFIFYPALCYKYGWVGVTLLWVAVPATIFSVLLFAKKWRRARIDSPVEYLETRYSPALRQVFAWQGIPVIVIDDALKLVAIGMFISVGLGLDMKLSMIGAGLIMLAYTFMGGLWAVAVTDFIQFIVLTVAVLIVVPLSLAKAGGVAAFLQNAPAGFFRLTSPEYDWFYVGAAVVLYCLAWSSINWSLIQRYYCVPKEKDALKVGWLVVGLYIVGPPLMFLPAMAATRFIGGLADAGKVYPLLCARLLPAGMFGLVIAAMFAATMSMLSSHYNVCASVLTNDVYRRLARPGASQKELVLVGRLMTLLIGIIALGAALLLYRGTGEDLFRTMMKLFSIATAPVAIPMLLGLLSKRVTNLSALVGFVCGIVVGLGLFFWCPDEMEFLGKIWKKETVLLMSTALVTSIAMLLVTLLRPMGAGERDRVESFHKRLATPIGQLAQDQLATTDEKILSPFRVVGISILFIGLLMLGVLPWVSGSLAFLLNLSLSGVLIVIGGLMTWRSGRSKPVRPGK